MAKYGKSRQDYYKHNQKTIREQQKAYYNSHKEEILAKLKTTSKKNKGLLRYKRTKSTVCDILEKHTEEQKDNPHHLSTEFILKQIEELRKNNTCKNQRMTQSQRINI